MAQRNREEVVNTELAVLISQFGVGAEAETILVHGTHRPDVIFQLRGLRVVIEGKFADTASPEQLVLEDARKRVRAGIAHIAAATIYPASLRSTSTAKMIEELKTSELRYRIISESNEGEMHHGTPADLMNALRRAQEALTKDDIVASTASSLSEKLDGIARLWGRQKGSLERLSTLLRITAPAGEKAEGQKDRHATTAKVAALVLANALIFQEQLSLSDERVNNLSKHIKSKNITKSLAEHWRWIWNEINYVTIFHVSEQVLGELSSSPETRSALLLLIDEAISICEKQTSLRHDLMGRIYHWLLHDAKFLGTYYTSTSASTLLAHLAMSLEWSQDLGDLQQLARFKVADLACGTGTLLMASAQAITDQFVLRRANSDRQIRSESFSTLHSTLMQNVIHGFDVLPTAVHLTASTLALLAPEIAFRQMNLHVMPMGLDQDTPRLGSIDFLHSRRLRTQFALDETQKEVERSSVFGSRYLNAEVPPLDLCIMNPPFVSSRYGNRLFGSLPAERKSLQAELSAHARKAGVSSTAGLGAIFVPLAAKYIKEGGRIAFVLPIALATGESWASVRQLIAESFHLELVVTSHDAERPNFSENTSLSEILFIARRRSGVGRPPTETNYVNLWKNPKTIHDALNCATRILSTIEVANQSGRGAASVRSGDSVYGEITRIRSPAGKQNWTGAIFAQSVLHSCYDSMNHDHKIQVPGDSDKIDLPLAPLQRLGELGHDARDIFDAFRVDETAAEWSPYAAFWNHDANRVTAIAQKPNAFLIKRDAAIEGRALKSAEAVWRKAGKTLLVSRLRTNTHRMIGVAFDQKVLGNTWWSFDDSALSDEQRKAFMLWINSTLGILMYYGGRAITEGAWMQMKKPAWHRMPVLDVRSLGRKQLTLLSAAYDASAKKKLLPISQLNNDPNRHQLDVALSRALGVPDVNVLRHLVAREPGLSAKSIMQTPAAKSNEFFLHPDQMQLAF